MSDRRRSYTDRRYVVFVTFSVAQRRRLLDCDQPKRVVLGTLNHQLTNYAAKCGGFVVMPDHVHALVWLPEPKKLSAFMHGWKRISSFQIRRWYAEHAPNYFEGFGPGDRFWNPKYFPFHIESEEKLREKLEYMHNNPVSAGLVKEQVEWPWSSAGWYLDGRSVGVPIEWLG